jgi:hypothetical protein
MIRTVWGGAKLEQVRSQSAVARDQEAKAAALAAAAKDTGVDMDTKHLEDVFNTIPREWLDKRCQ